MAFDNNFNNSEGDDKKNIAYDLRQIYAKIVGEHLIDISLYRRRQDFGQWFRALENLYTITSFKFSDKDICDKEFERLKNIIHRLSNIHYACWKGDAKHPQKTSDIDKSLRILEDFIYSKMEDSGIWGKGYEYDEDEI